MREVSAVTDYYLLASGSSSPQLKAMFTDVQHALKEENVYCYRRTGTPESGWLVLDYVDVVIHIFAEEARKYYAIEELWEGAPRL